MVAGALGVCPCFTGRETSANAPNNRPPKRIGAREKRRFMREQPVIAQFIGCVYRSASLLLLDKQIEIT
jgi:hypothetical protein